MKELCCALTLLLALTGATAQDQKNLGAAAANSGDLPKAYALWLPLAQAGDPEVQEAVALLLASDEDIGVQFSVRARSAAIRYWLLKAAKGGNQSASQWLSDALLRGWYDFRKDDKGAKCWKDVAASGAKSDDCERFTLTP